MTYGIITFILWWCLSFYILLRVFEVILKTLLEMILFIEKTIVLVTKILSYLGIIIWLWYIIKLLFIFI